MYEIEPGDILFTRNTSWQGKSTEWGQTLARGSSSANIVHAAIAVSDLTVAKNNPLNSTEYLATIKRDASNSKVELYGDGLNRYTMKNSGVLDIFRCEATHLSYAAADLAYDIFVKSNRLQANAKKGVSFRISGRKGCLLGLFSRMPLQGHARTLEIARRLSEDGYSFYCSSFVAFCYQDALAKARYDRFGLSDELERVFGREHHGYNPSRLYDKLKRSFAFRYVGTNTYGAG